MNRVIDRFHRVITTLRGLRKDYFKTQPHSTSVSGTDCIDLGGTGA